MLMQLNGFLHWITEIPHITHLLPYINLYMLNPRHVVWKIFPFEFHKQQNDRLKSFCYMNRIALIQL